MSARFCQHCGTELKDGVCPNCGASSSDNPQESKKTEVYSKDYFKGKRPLGRGTFYAMLFIAVAVIMIVVLAVAL